MIQRFARIAAASAVLAQTMWGASLTAQQRTLELDPAKTQIQWTLGDVLHTVHGVFRMKSGVIQFDPTTGDASGAIVVDADSGDSGTKARDKKMDKDVLQTSQYPEIAFYPKKVIGNVPVQGGSRIQVQGIFRLHGQDHNLTMVIPLTVSGDQVRADTQFVVPYVAWGLKDPSTLFLRVAKDVQISINTAGNLK
ncbi:MAG TPA: YceI family protein [Terriglobales bacterium]|nr:YceI family protein [Terriglobales bacterium]